MAVTREDVRYIAKLARLRFEPEEEERLASEMSRILDYMDQLQALNTAGVPPMTHVLDQHDVVRPDAPLQRLTHEEALRPAPDTDGNYFRVPKVIE